MAINNVDLAAPLISITPIYAALFGLMLVYLSALVIKNRRAKVSLGDGEDPALRKVIAVHSKFHNICHLHYCSLLLLS